MKTEKKNKEGPASRLRMSVMLFLIALTSIAAATTAWFSISDNGKVNTLDFDVTSGVAMKFDLNSHSDIDQYVDTLNFKQISASMKSRYGYDMTKQPLEPVTTSNCSAFKYEDGSTVSEKSGEYLTFTLHFMSQENLVVHLSSDNADNKQGTIVSSKNKNLADAMRISFTADGKTYVYDPGMGNRATYKGNIKTFGLNTNSADYNDNNAMFNLTAEQDKEVLIHVWLEGTDEKCVDDLKGSEYSIALKFEGTDEHNNPIDDNGEGNEGKSKKRNKVKSTDEERPEDWIDRLLEALNSIVDNHNK